MVRWPGKVKPGAVVQQIASSLDWFPTMATLAGYTLTEGVKFDGHDMSGLLFFGLPGLRNTVYYHATDGDAPLNAVRIRSFEKYRMQYVVDRLNACTFCMPICRRSVVGSINCTCARKADCA
jgi:arylsulfatase A-like enzyme